MDGKVILSVQGAAAHAGPARGATKNEVARGFLRGGGGLGAVAHACVCGSQAATAVRGECKGWRGNVIPGDRVGE